MLGRRRGFRIELWFVVRVLERFVVRVLERFVFGVFEWFVIPATLGTGRWGQLDLAGNVQEFALDMYVSSYYPCTDCAYLTPSSCPNNPAIQCRVIRSASFRQEATYLLPPVRNYDGPAIGRSIDVGFRCARAP